jgi:hypothetical protein
MIQEGEIDNFQNNLRRTITRDIRTVGRFAAGAGHPDQVQAVDVLLGAPTTTDTVDGSAHVTRGVSPGGGSAPSSTPAIPGQRAHALVEARAQARRLLADARHGPGRTADGHPVALLANIDAE